MAERPPSNLVMRLLSAAVAIPAILAVVYLAPPWAFYLLALPTALLGCYELFAMTHPGDRVTQLAGLVVAALTSLAVYFFTSDAKVLMTVLIVVPILGPFITLARLGDMHTAALRACALAFGPLFVAVPLTLLAAMRRDVGADGPGYVLLVLMLSWFGDTGGYFGGRYLGKHKLYEAVSPKKTVEGAIGGLAGSLIGSVLASLVYLRSLPLAHSLPLAIVGGAAGQAGDLAESLLKRSTGVKDSGHIVPGHGGILDRVDALLLATSVVYLYTLWLR